MQSNLRRVRHHHHRFTRPGPSFDDVQKALKHAPEVTPKDHNAAKIHVSAPRLVILVDLFIIISFRPSLVMTIDAWSLDIR
jgi:hypothetical protein